MPTPVVTRQHLEKAWLEATGVATTLTPARWNTEIVRSFVSEVPTIASVIIAAGHKRFQLRERAFIAQWICAWLHLAYKIAGAKFSPLDKDDLIGLLTAEQEHLVRVSRMNPAQMEAAENQRMREIPNGRLLEMLMQMWGKACIQVAKQGEDPTSVTQDTYFARLHLAVILAALNLSSERAE